VSQNDSTNDNSEDTPENSADAGAMDPVDKAAAEAASDVENSEAPTEMAGDHSGHDDSTDPGDHHDLGPTGEDAVEPDETPDNFLIMVGVGLTVAVVIAVFIGVTLFDSTLASQRAAKGYDNAPAYHLSR